MLAGRFSKYMNTPLAKGAAIALPLGVGGSLLGNVMDKEKGEGSARVVTEAGLAGLNAAGSLGGVMAAEGLGLSPNVQRGPLPDTGVQLPNRRASKLAYSAAALPIAAGIGGLVGGGVSNIANAIGIPGFNRGINPSKVGLPSLDANALYQMQKDLNKKAQK